MKTVKTSELQGAALDWAVAKCEGLSEYETPLFLKFYRDAEGDGDAEYRYSTNWSQGGPIIEREYISVLSHLVASWKAHVVTANANYISDGPTPLIAAMRCYVASKLGDDVDIPEELI